MPGPADADKTRPVDPVTLAQAARILGCSRSTVRRHFLAARLVSHDGRYEHRTLSRAEDETLALELYDWRRHVDDPESYWLTSHQAAEMLGISRQRLGQVGDKGFLPFVRHRDGVRLYRREQLVTIANARPARWH